MTTASRAVTRRHRPTAAPPPRRDDGSYEVQPTDSYWTISEKVYGSTAYFKALYEHNRSKLGDDERLKPGDLVSTPPVAELEKGVSRLCVRRRVGARRCESRAIGRQHAPVVPRRADLHGIGGRHALQHRPLRVGQGLALGRDLRAQPRPAGQGLQLSHARHEARLPDGEKSDTVAEPPSRGYRR